MAMAEDDLLLNFDLNVDAIKSRPTFKGGKWRDRLHAKRGNKYREKKIASGVNAVIQEGGDRNERPRRNFPVTQVFDESDHVLQPVEDASVRPAKKPRLATDITPKATSKPATEVISSLFSYNPASKAPSTTEIIPSAPLAPSNAPLPPTISNDFTALGVSPALASHLVNKHIVNTPTAIQSVALPHLLSSDGDAFIRAETGSGKTLTYLLPIVQRILGLSSSHSPSALKLGRTSGLYAVILAPTRDLARQIHMVLTKLLVPYPYLVAGLVLGGEKKKSEKARLRKGLNILVATPGRLVDHLDNTEVLKLDDVRWLILDEGDRLMEMGFEEDLRKVIEALRKRETQRNIGIPRTREATLPQRRVTVLCSATMQDGVKRLGDLSLKEATMLTPIADVDELHKERHSKQKGVTQEDTERDAEGTIPALAVQGRIPTAKDEERSTTIDENTSKFQAPAQLQQSCIISPPKQRLVTLVAHLKSTFTSSLAKPSVRKVLVFLSCADSVDFHFQILVSSNLDEDNAGHSKDGGHSINAITRHQLSETMAPCPHLPSQPLIHRLHGSLAPHLRTSTLAAFSSSTSPSILLCTDVASRGLDLPDIDLVIEYDPAFGIEDHLHRVGRTARAGRAGQATVFLMTGPEEVYTSVLEKTLVGGEDERRLTHRTAEEVLKLGFSSPKPSNHASKPTPRSKSTSPMKPYEEAATNFQLAVERWVASTPSILELARKAYISHVRAYSTHVKPERHIFDVKALHLGHLAKAFGLRERPGHFGRGNTGSSSAMGRKSVSVTEGKKSRKRATDGAVLEDVNAEVEDVDVARRKMRAMAKMQGAGASEFNIG